jgi:alkanesulfonate monooxygenase SsuD/methylene tetrahydromethanopterin reductase-like flavin-dependent oxidoreductase (luciferase family)
MLYEQQLPRPWDERSEYQMFQDALDQVVLADRLGFDHAWQVEHHFMDEFSHSSSPETFLAAAAARTSRIRLSHGIRHCHPNINHPARVAEQISTLDLISGGRVDFGFGAGATRIEIEGYGASLHNRAQASLEAVEQIVNMMTMEPYPGFDGRFFTMPCRNVLPKPMQKPHPPLWLACTQYETIKQAARLGVGALAFAFVDPQDARRWVDTYYDIIRSEECVPIGETVNANVAMTTPFFLHADRDEAIRRGQESFEFFVYALKATLIGDVYPGRTHHWSDFEAWRAAQAGQPHPAPPGLGAPADVLPLFEGFAAAGVDQVVLLQQAGRIRHEHICESLELFGETFIPRLGADEAGREARKAAALAPYIEAALRRRRRMTPLAENGVPVIPGVVDAVAPGER